MGGRVVVGVGEHASGGRTLAWALREAQAVRSELVVVRAGVADRAVVGALARGRLSALEVVDPALARAVSAARLLLGDERVAVVVDRDAPGPLLIRTAQPADLLVVGPPTRASWWSGPSTTHQVSTRADCPVVVVHGAAAAARPRGVRPDVVVGVDGSPAARSALAFGFSYAASHDLPLVAAFVTAHGNGAALLAEEVHPWQFEYPAVAVRRVLLPGDPEEALRWFARGAALLTVGSTGTGLASLGSIGRGLVTRAECPVAIV
jgi:nucleotide-binding universal stress UspA family protein